MRRAFKSELDGMAAVARERQRRNVDGPTLDEILKVARDYVEVALTQNIFCRGEKAAFEFGDDRTVWAFGWPIGEWVSRAEMFGGDGDELIALRIFDPQLRESLHWFVHTSDRLRYNAEQDKPKKRSVTQIERDEVELPLAESRKSRGHIVQRQVICGAGRIDILDVTANEIIECKASGSAGDIVAAVTQLRRYSAHYSGARLVVAVPWIDVEAAWLVDLLSRIGIFVIEVSDS